MHVGLDLITWASGLDWDSDKAGDGKKAKIKGPSRANGVSYCDIVDLLPVYFW